MIFDIDHRLDILHIFAGFGGNTRYVRLKN